jgi:hypothetical protein
MITSDSLTPLVLQAQAGDRDAFSDLVVLFPVTYLRNRDAAIA